MRLITFIVLILLFLQGCAGTEKVSKERNNSLKGSEEIKPIVLKEFVLGPGDIIEIMVWRNDDLNRKIQISSSGDFSYPLIGTIKAGGLSIFQLRDEITNGLSKYLVDPQVTININSNQSKKVFVLGEVNRPGAFQITSYISTLEAVSMAGGLTNDAKTKNILLVRGNLKNPELKSINLNKALKKGDLTQNVIIQPGDVVYVPTSTFADVEKFFKRIGSIIYPIVALETGIALEPFVEDVFTGEREEAQRVIIAPR